MGLFKKRRYYFSDTSIATDTVIAYAMAGVALFIEILGIIASIATKGHVPLIFGVLYIIAIVLAIVGECFALWGNKADEGSVTGKKISMLLNVLAFVIPVVIIIF